MDSYPSYATHLLPDKRPQHNTICAGAAKALAKRTEELQNLNLQHVGQ